MSEEANRVRGRLLRGAREIARHIYGDDRDWRSIYPLAPELPIFMLGGRICGYMGSLDVAMAAKEAAGKEPTATQMQRSAKFACERETL